MEIRMTVHFWGRALAIALVGIIGPVGCGSITGGTTASGSGGQGGGTTSSTSSTGAAGICMVGEQQCEGQQLEKCDASGMWTAQGAACDANATCSADPGGLACTCNDGFTGDGFSCMACPPEETPVSAWGDDFWGEATVPAGLGVVTAIAAGGYAPNLSSAHTVALKSGGTVVAWGQA